MAITLGLTLPLMEGEPTTYFASRLAARNFLKARPFAADMGFSYSALDRGCEIAISRLSEISGVSVAALAANASHRVDEWLNLRGQLINFRNRDGTLSLPFARHVSRPTSRVVISPRRLQFAAVFRGC